MCSDSHAREIFWFEKGETNFIRFAGKKDSVLFFYGSAEAP